MKLICLSVFGLTSCGSNTSSQSPVVIKSEGFSSLSGRQFFEGLLFGQGEAAKALPEIWQDPQIVSMMLGEPKSNTEVMNAISLVENKLSKDDPSIFDRFKSDMTSGNPLLVETALDNMASKVQKISDTSESAGDFKGTCIAAAAVVITVGAVYTVGAIAVFYAVVFVKTAIWATSSLDNAGNFSSQSNSLAKENMINSLTNTLYIQRI